MWGLLGEIKIPCVQAKALKVEVWSLRERAGKPAVHLQCFKLGCSYGTLVRFMKSVCTLQ